MMILSQIITTMTPDSAATAEMAAWIAVNVVLLAVFVVNLRARQWSWIGLILSLACGIAASFHLLGTIQMLLEPPQRYSPMTFPLVTFDRNLIDGTILTAIGLGLAGAMVAALREPRAWSTLLILAVCLYALTMIGALAMGVLVLGKGAINVEFEGVGKVSQTIAQTVIIGMVVAPFSIGIPWSLVRQSSRRQTFARTVATRYALAIGTVLVIIALVVAGVFSAMNLALIEAGGAQPFSRGSLLTALAVFMCGSLLVFLGMWRWFLEPAIEILEAIRQDAPSAPIGVRSALWQPVATALQNSRSEADSHLRTLEEHNRLVDSILTSSIDSIVTTDETGTITSFNPTAERVFGWSRHEVLGKPMEDTIIPDDLRERHRAGMQRYLASGEPRVLGKVVELRGLRRSGEEFPMELAIAETRSGGKQVFIGFMRDLTSRKQAEAELAKSQEALHQSEKLAALGQLLAGVAHELNNPLAIVLGRAAILSEKLEGTPHAASLGKLRDAADRCARIVRTFLAMARQSGPRRGITQINDLVEGALDMTAYGLRDAGIELRQQLEPSLPAIDVDADQIVQVLINLIVNAQHALETVEGSRHIEVRTRRGATHKRLMIEVADNGPGIPAHVAARMFDPFFTTKGVGKGNGLGLSVCKSMVEAHGGTLTYRKRPGSGALFTVDLPLIASLAAEGLEAEGSHSGQRDGHILVIDDEPEIAAILVDCLLPLGLTCEIASDASIALALIGEQNFDAILCDVRLPGIDGIAFHSRLATERPELAARLAFISGDVLHRDIEQLRAASDRPIIEKPFNPESVRDVVRALIASPGEQP